MRYAAIDTGSNAVRLLIADIVKNKDGYTFKKNVLIRVPLRLGDDAFISKSISSQKVNDLVKAMAAFKSLMELYEVSDYMACATSAMREAENGRQIVERINNEANIVLEIVEGQREANIIYSSHINDKLNKENNYLYIDVGGGSTELSFFADGQPEVSQSFNIGTIRILDKQDRKETWNEMKDYIKHHAKKYKDLAGIGTGGNINKLFRMSEEKEGEPLSLNKLNALHKYLNSYSLEERINELGLNPDRADVIVPACEIFTSVMDWADIKNVYVPKVGMVDGIIQLLIEKNLR